MCVWSVVGYAGFVVCLLFGVIGLLCFVGVWVARLGLGLADFVVWVVGMLLVNLWVLIVCCLLLFVLWSDACLGVVCLAVAMAWCWFGLMSGFL